MQHSRTLGLALMLGLVATPAFAGAPILDGAAEPRGLDRQGNPAILLVQAQSPSQRAREQAILGQLEEEIRRLNGRIEQLEFEQRNTNRRIDQLIGDLDQRLGVLEGGGSAAVDRPAREPPNETAAGTSEGSERAGVSPDQALRELLGEPAGDGSLGRIPESAVTGLPRPNPADVAAPEKSTLTPEQQYENAVQLLQAGDYQGAQGGLELFLDLNENHQLASNASYWLAETHYVRQNYSAAAAAFARNYRTYGKESSKAIDNLLKLGMSLANLGENDKACLSYEELDRTFPNAPAHIQQALSRERARAQCS